MKNRNTGDKRKNPAKIQKVRDGRIKTPREHAGKWATM